MPRRGGFGIASRGFLAGIATFLLAPSPGFPSDLAWQSRADLPTGRTYLAAATIGGTAYVVGGLVGASSQASLEAYDSDGGTWSILAAMPTARRSLGCASIAGTLYAVGGATAGWTATAKLEAWDTATRTWATLAPMGFARLGLAVAAMSGSVYAVGGFGSQQKVEAYDPATDTWTALAELPGARYGLAAAAIGGSLYVVGGTMGSAVSATCWVFDPATNTWTVKAPMPTARTELAVVAIGGTLYAIGGSDGSVPLDVVEAYDSASDAWVAKAGILDAPRQKMGVAVIAGTIYLAGGSVTGGSDASTGSFAGLPDALPVLSWLGGVGYAGDGVDPGDGHGTSVFAWRVRYSHAGGIGPGTGYPRVRIFRDGTEVAGSPFAMAAESGSPATGCVFAHTGSLGVAGSDYRYVFEARDAMNGRAVGEARATLAGPSVVEGILATPDLFSNLPGDGKIQVRNNVIRISRGTIGYVVIKTGTAGKSVTVRLMSPAGAPIREFAPTDVQWRRDGTVGILEFDGRVGGKPLPTGTYWMTATGGGVGDRKPLVIVAPEIP